MPLVGCPRCHTMIESTGGAVRCPQCGAHSAPGGTTIVVQQQQSQNSAGHGLAIAALILGLASLFVAGPLTAVPAVICGALALKQGADGADKGMAITGIILGAIILLLTVLFLMFMGFIFTEIMTEF